MPLLDRPGPPLPPSLAFRILIACAHHTPRAGRVNSYGMRGDGAATAVFTTEVTEDAEKGGTLMDGMATAHGAGPRGASGVSARS